MSNYKPIAELADEIGKSRIAVYRAGKRGTFPLEEVDGRLQVDLDNEKVRDYINPKKKVKVKAKKKPERKKSVKVKVKIPPKKKTTVKVSKQKTPIKSNSVKEDKLPDNFIKKLDAGKLSASEIIGFPKAIVEKIKIYESTKQIVQKRQKDRHELIETRLLRVTLGKLFEIHVNEFLTIKAKSIPDIAGIFGVTDSSKMLKAEKVLDDELWKVLRHIKYEFNKFLTRTGNDKID